MTAPPLLLSAGDPGRDTLATGRVTLVMGGEPVEVELSVPTGVVAFDDLLPVLHGLTDFLVDRGVAAAEAAGLKISCRAGCGACCRQIVPISQAEARHLARLVEAMPEPRRTQVRERFDAALAALDAGGLLEAIDAAREQVDGDARVELGRRYFGQGVACPFLEDESCGIHPERPLSCRQYLVTSPADRCRTPSPETIDTVTLPARPTQALLLADGDDSGAPWMPLVYALAYAANIPPPEPTRSAPDILRDVFSRL